MSERSVRPAVFARAMDEARRPSGLVLGTAVAVLVTAAVFGAGRLLRLVETPEFLADGGIVALTPAFLVVWVLLWVWLRFKEQRPFAGLGFRERRRAGIRATRGAGIALAQMGVYVVVGVTTGSLVFVADASGGVVHTASLGWVLLAIVAFAVQSGAEEVTARGYLVQVWYRRTGVVGALVVSMVFFTAAHSVSGDFSLLPMIDMSLYSVVAVLWALSERSLWGVIGYHATWNWVQGSLFGVAVSGTEVPNSLLVVGATPSAPEWITGGDYGAEGSLVDIAVLLVLIAGAVVAYRRSRRDQGALDSSSAAAASSSSASSA
ncbi:CPBP family intramembrane glutamic endopeptidase [Herbiconiux sp. 11R-BC]|uniref:CPBP family intramembrane glutamic endopeptidase n=1 Tax=Herbiconiux sp. 11R-BC TaxID=3111637 RepID=UPI003BFC0FBB